MPLLVLRASGDASLAAMMSRQTRSYPASRGCAGADRQPFANSDVALLGLSVEAKA